jgi:hypothetical protein
LENRWPTWQTAGRLGDVAALELGDVPVSGPREFGRITMLAFGNVAADQEVEAAVREICDPDWA